ncbi:MAG: hypothetical protein K2Y01_05045 [Rhabdochlamydiaceae bacterium]|nr:hypothetical protein [Rhabdochlamydiaceae bacterium]
MRKTLKITLWITCFSLTALVLADFCHDKTKGFQRERMAPAFTPPVAVHAFSFIPHKELIPILSQPFTYLKKGRSSYVFVSDDQKYVLKFLRNPQISSPYWASCLLSQKLFPSLCQKNLETKQKRKQKQETSYEIAFHKIPSQTAVLCLHLHESSSLRKNFTIYDAIRIQHKVPMDATAFILQKKADPFCPYFQALYNEKKQEEIHTLIRQFAVLLKERADYGISDHDLSPRYNLGILEGNLVTFDLDSLISAPLSQTSQERRNHMQQDAKKMLVYLRDFSPDFELLLQQEIEKFSFLF